MILCIGTTPAVQRVMIFDRLLPSAVNRAVQVVEGAAGKSVNVAKVLTVLGQKALATGFLGGDRGQFMRQELDRLGVPHDFVDVSAQTRMCVTLIDRGSDVHTELVEESPPADTESWDQLRARINAHLTAARMLVMSGTLAPGASPAFYADCVKLAHGRGIPAVVDATGEALLQGAVAGAALVKPNRGELARTLNIDTGSDQGLCEGMREMLKRGARTIVVTLGAEGAMSFDGREFWRIHTPRVRAFNSIGSGDAFTAGLILGMVRGQPLHESARLAAACGAANALTVMSGEVHLEDVQRLLPEVRVDPA